MPAVFRTQVFSLICFPLLIAALTLLPFFVGVFALILLTFRDDVPLPEQSKRWANTFIKVFLIDFNPVNIPCLFPDLDAFKNLLLVGFERREVIWSKHICWTVETRQFHEFAHDFRRFQTRTQRHFDVLSMFTNPFGVKGVRARHGQELLPRHTLWLPLIKLDNAFLDRLFPGFPHRFIQDFGVDQGHFWTCMRHPLLNKNQAHSIVDEFHSLRMTKRVETEVKNVPLFILYLIFARQVIQANSNGGSSKRVPQ